MANLVKFSHHLYLNCYYPLNFPKVLNCLGRRREHLNLSDFKSFHQLTNLPLHTSQTRIQPLYLMSCSVSSYKMITLKEQTEIEMFFLPAELPKGAKKDLESYLTLNGTWAQGRESVFIVSSHASLQLFPLSRPFSVKSIGLTAVY